MISLSKSNLNVLTCSCNISLHNQIFLNVLVTSRSLTKCFILLPLITTSPLLILSIYLNVCIRISECSYQLKQSTKKIIKSSIPLIVNNDFSMSNNLQVLSSLVTRHKASFSMAFKNTVQNVFLHNYFTLKCISLDYINRYFT